MAAAVLAGLILAGTPQTRGEQGPGAGQTTNHASFAEMHVGLFAHYTYVGKPYEFGSTTWADRREVRSLDELADNLDVEEFAAMAATMRAQYALFTAWHANMNVLFPSAAMKRHLPGHCSRRDAVGDLIRALKARNIRPMLYIHPSDGHDFTREDQDRVGWNDGRPFARWNDFINEVIAEVVERYGKDVSGYYIDGGLPRKVDAPRLRKTILDRQADAWLIQNSGLNRACVDYGATERMERPACPATTWLRCENITAEWWAKGTTVHWKPELAYQYTILQAAVTGRMGGGVAWSFGPHPGGKWEEGVPAFCQRLGALLDRTGPSLFGTRPSRAYAVKNRQPLQGLAYVATESPDGKRTFLHVFLPPKERTLQLPAPTDGRHFSSAQLLSNGHKVSLLQTDTAVGLTLDPADQWDEVDTTLLLE